MSFKLLGFNPCHSKQYFCHYLDALEKEINVRFIFLLLNNIIDRTLTMMRLESNNWMDESFKIFSRKTISKFQNLVF